MIFLTGSELAAIADINVKKLWNASPALRFLVVGGWNFAFGYAAFAVPYWMFAGRCPDWLIAAFAAVAGITMSFVTHRFFTYRSHGVWWREYLKFYVVYGVQSLLNVVLIWMLVTKLGFNAYVIQLVVALALTFGSYWAHKKFSFRRRET